MSFVTHAAPLAAHRFPRLLVALLAASLLLGLSMANRPARTDANDAAVGHIVVLDGVVAADGSFQVGGNDLANLAAARQLIAASGASLEVDLADQVGVLLVRATPQAAAAIAASGLVADAAPDFAWKALPSYEEALASGELTLVAANRAPEGGAEQTADPLEALQWDMAQMDTTAAHDIQAGARSVDVGILDSGIDGSHPDFVLDGGWSNVDCARGRNSVLFVPEGPGAGNPVPCVDNHFHGTHVAGTVAAQANGIGIVGVAPNVTLVPVKVCDASGYCYASGVIDGITYAGDQRLDVINMSFFVDDDASRSRPSSSAVPTRRSVRFEPPSNARSRTR